jgi:hypothetical protein
MAKCFGNTLLQFGVGMIPGSGMISMDISNHITGDGVNYYTIDKNIETKAHIKRQMIFDA